MNIPIRFNASGNEYTMYRISKQYMYIQRNCHTLKINVDHIAKTDLTKAEYRDIYKAVRENDRATLTFYTLR